jgi:hypothetical protein
MMRRDVEKELLDIMESGREVEEMEVERENESELEERNLMGKLLEIMENDQELEEMEVERDNESELEERSLMGKLLEIMENDQELEGKMEVERESGQQKNPWVWRFDNISDSA